MKRLYGLLLLLAAVAVAIPAIERMTDRAGGRDSGRGGRPEARDTATRPMQSAAPSSGTLYRWRDAGGTLHIESSPPADQSRYEAIRFSSRAPAGQQRGTDSTAGGGSRQTPPPTARQQRLGERPLSAYSPQGLNELLDRVETTAGQLDEREQTFRDLKKEL